MHICIYIYIAIYVSNYYLAATTSHLVSLVRPTAVLPAIAHPLYSLYTLRFLSYPLSTPLWTPVGTFKFLYGVRSISRILPKGMKLCKTLDANQPL